ncbi:tetratricopeptide repeat-containing sensor histidine kinase [Chryseobacterium gambrini]|uniref:tetratricopeptide repeat-containing sensor histidine kinase n=1 Tax=Chryseobacterium gambrini TaxID=373672 RepID=UPI0025B41B94|nr:ATP-binding protein [Chryseobacterium gambrini]MDN4029683.1 hypothetical protein [Chryseobacterium gambrini]
MKNLLILILLTIIFSCKKDNNKIDFLITSNENFDKAKKLKDINLDSAFIYFNLAKNDFLSNNDSIGAARSLVNMAIIQSDKGDYYGSIETSLEADKYLKTAIKNEFVNNLYSSNNNNLAISSKSLKNYPDAEKYYQNALKTTLKENYIYVINNNISDMLILQNKIEPAINHLQKLLNSKDSKNDSINYARVLNNLAKAKFLGNKHYNPIPELERALKIRESEKDTLGLNSSFATFADYFYTKDKTKSLFYAKMMLNRATLNKSPDDQLEALEKIINLDNQNYLKYFERFQKLNDSVQTSRNKAKNQFAIIRYDVEQKNADNQKLHSDNLKKNFGITVLALLLIAGIFWYIKRQKQLKQEKELEVKNAQLKMSKKVHDVVANGIYQVMAKIENQEDFDREKTLDELEFVYEKSRNLSYEKAGEEKEFSQEISELIASFNNASVKTFTAGNSSSVWTNISAPVKEEIYQVLRELMVNMKKHSKASHVAVKFEKADQNIEIQYKDNGVGISGDLIYKNGLRNTASRIEGIGGNITFETKIEKGLKVNISFPSS